MIQAVYDVPRLIVECGTTHVERAVRAIELASRLSGSGKVTTHGTLRQLREGLLEFDYSQAPDDRLRVVPKGEPTTDYVISTLRGDLTRDADTFLGGRHDLGVRVIQANAPDLRFFVTQRIDAENPYVSHQQVEIRGEYAFAGRTFEVNVKTTSRTFFETDSTGLERKSEGRFQGQITTEGVVIDVDETLTFELVHVTATRFQRSKSSSAMERVLRSAWTVGEDRYRFDDAVLRWEYLDGKPNLRNDYWKASGNLLKNDEVRGELALGGTAYLDYLDKRPFAGELYAHVKVGDESIPLQSWTVH